MKLVQRMLNSDLDIEQISRLMISNPRSEDIIRTSKALCVLGDEDVAAPSDREYRESCMLYALFLKTVIEIFTKNSGSIVDGWSPEKIKSHLKRIPKTAFLTTGRHSVFLGRYEFSEGEINLNRKVQLSFWKLSRK